MGSIKVIAPSKTITLTHLTVVRVHYGDTCISPYTLTNYDAGVAGNVLAAVGHVAHLHGVIEHSSRLNTEQVVSSYCFLALRNSQHFRDVGKGCAVDEKDTCADFSVLGITVADGDEGKDVHGARVSAKSPD